MREVRVRTRNVFTRWDVLLFALLTAMTYTALLFFLRHWFSYGDWRGHPLAFGGLTVLLMSRWTAHQLRWWGLPCIRHPVKLVARSGWRVGVATTFVPGTESIEMLAETVRALVTMD